MLIPGNAAALIDQYVRGSDLVATYDETAPLPVKSQIYWRTFEMGQTSLVGVELILSMQTSLLDSDPGMVVSSELPAAEVLHLANISPLEVVSVERQVSRIDSRTSSGLVIVRLPDCGVSWIQMVYPNDFLTVEVQVDPSGIATVSHRLFSERLEKGVIRRGRLRGILVPQADDVAIALECYAKLGSSLPPLTV